MHMLSSAKWRRSSARCSGAMPPLVPPRRRVRWLLVVGAFAVLALGHRLRAPTEARLSLVPSQPESTEPPPAPEEPEVEMPLVTAGRCPLDLVPPAMVEHLSDA